MPTPADPPPAGSPGGGAPSSPVGQPAAPSVAQDVGPVQLDQEEAAALRKRLSPLRLLLQMIGLGVGLALLIWAVSLAFSGDNAQSLERLRHAPAHEVALLMACSFASLVLNGLMFWIVLRPVKRLNALDVTLVNSIATFLSILPFKISLMMRVLIHHRRDGVPLVTLVAWVAAMGALGLAVLLPFVGATLWRQGLDALWWVSALAGAAVCSALGVFLGRLADRVTILKKLSFGSYTIVRHTSAVVGHGVLRLADVAVLAGRFLSAAMIVDLDLPLDQAVLLATTYFVLSVVTPAGTLGVRESGVALLGISQGLDSAGIALIALVVTGAEVIASGALALAGLVRIRPDRILGAKRHNAG